MPSKQDRANRKDMLRGLRDRERQKAQEAFPVSHEALEQLFDYLDDRLSTASCDHTLHFAREFTVRSFLPEMKVVSWLEENGGHCDCEVLSNVAEIVSEAIAQNSRPRANLLK